MDLNNALLVIGVASALLLVVATFTLLLRPEEEERPAEPPTYSVEEWEIWNGTGRGVGPSTRPDAIARWNRPTK